MKKYRIGFDLLLASLLAWMAAFPVCADSSWQWISETRPYDLLPPVIAGTLVIEITAVLLALKNRKLWKVLFIVTLANLLSFAAPYLLMYVELRDLGGSQSFVSYLDKFPNYVIGIAYLNLTVLIELPVVWLTLRKDSKNQWWFLVVILAANAVTTGLTYWVERHFCYGRW